MKDEQTTTVSQFEEYAMLALHDLGGDATFDSLMGYIGIHFPLHPADHAPMCEGPTGQTEAPEGYTGYTWPRWVGRAKLAIMARLTARHHWITKHEQDGYYTMTEQGRRYLMLLLQRRMLQEELAKVEARIKEFRHS